MMLAALGAGLGPMPPEPRDPMWTADLRPPRLYGRFYSPAAWALRCEKRRAEWVGTMPLLAVNPKIDRGVLKVLAGVRRARTAKERATERVVEMHAALRAGEHMHADAMARELLDLATGGAT